MRKVNTHIHVRNEYCVDEKAGPCGIVIFGASGDLTGRKLVPALFHLYRRGLMPDNFFVLGAARTPMADDVCRENVRQFIKMPAEQSGDGDVKGFVERFCYMNGDLSDPQFYRRLKERLAQLHKQRSTGGNTLFYFAVPPFLASTIASNLYESGLAAEGRDGSQWSRVVIEKPFGRDLESALELDRQLRSSLKERQIYRIDHYLGKETVQNILMFRFANAVFEPVWNRQYIDHVQITAAESIGVEERAGYFDNAGHLRDMFQNHMLQLLAMTAMEAPASFDADRVRDERIKLIRAIRRFSPDNLDRRIVKGQYGPGEIDGKPVAAYRDEDDVRADSRTETFVAAKVMIDNWRWQGVPFYIRSGKRLPCKVTEIAVSFKKVPHSMFQGLTTEELRPNTLIFNVQPHEGITLAIQAKHPGPKICMTTLGLDFFYHEIFDADPPEAYQRLLLDCMLGDQTLFVRHDYMDVSWSLLTPVLKAWEADASNPLPYPAGSWGPPEAEVLMANDGREWRKPCPVGSQPW